MLNRKTNPIEQNGHIFHITVHSSEHAIHMGNAYTMVVSRNLAEAGVDNITITVPEGFRCHFSYTLETGLAAHWAVYKDSVVTGGTVEAARNRNETVTKTDGPSLRFNGTVTTPGELIAEWAWGTVSTHPQDPGVGSANEDSGIVWPAGAVRRFQLTSDADDNRCLIRLNFVMEEMIPEEL